jgi:hypothetical protein
MAKKDPDEEYRKNQDKKEKEAGTGKLGKRKTTTSYQTTYGSKAQKGIIPTSKAARSSGVEKRTLNRADLHLKKQRPDLYPEDKPHAPKSLKKKKITKK